MQAEVGTGELFVTESSVWEMTIGQLDKVGEIWEEMTIGQLDKVGEIWGEMTIG